MTAFTPVATGPVADVAEFDDLILRPDVPQLDVTAADPTVVSGGSGVAPEAVLTVSAPTPIIAAGALVSAPVALIDLSAPDTFVSISGTVSPPSAALQLDAPTPAVLAGASGVPPAGDVVISAPAPIVGAGVRSDQTNVVGELSAPTPFASSGKRVDPPAVNLTLEALLPTILTGRYIEASNTVSIESDNGSVAGGPVAEFAAAVGERFVFSRRIPPSFELTAPLPSVLAGTAIFVPAVQISLSSSPLEVRARRRPLVVLGIAS